LLGKRINCRHCQKPFAVYRVPGRKAGPKGKWGRTVAAAVGAALVAVVGLTLLVWLLTPSEVEQKLAELQDGTPAARARALVWLTRADPQDAFHARVTAALEPPLFDGDPGRALDPDLLLRAYLHWADRDNVPTLLRMVENPTLPSWNPKKAGLILATLGRLGDERAIPALAERLSDPVLHDQAVNALKLIGPRAENEVMDYLFDPDPATRQQADRLLADYGIKPETVAAEALARLKSNRADERRGAAVWFAENPPEGEREKAAVAKSLLPLLDDLSPKANDAALRALKSWATKDCLPPLLDFARREQKAGRGDPVLIDLLAQFRDKTAAEAIALQLKNASQRGKAAQALVKLGPVAAGAVVGYINHPDPAVRKEARSLCRLLKVPADRQLTQALADLADTRSPRSRVALHFLAGLRPDPARRDQVARALNAPLLDPDPAVRGGALDAVAVWGTKANTETLLEALGNLPGGRPEMVPRLIAVLSSLHDPAAASVLAQGLTEPHARALVGQALAGMGPAAEDAVLPFLRSVDEGTRLAASWILGEIGTSKSLQPLKEAMESATWTSPVAKAALVALQKIQARQ
jgi:hypothetical protein